MCFRDVINRRELRELERNITRIRRRSFHDSTDVDGRNATLTGVRVQRVKLSVYVLSGLLSGITAVLLVGYQGAAINAMGTGYELRAIASSVIGGTDLMGGAGGAYGAFIGAALIEVIRNSLLLAGVDANWEGTFVGLFIVFAVALSKFRELKSG